MELLKRYSAINKHSLLIRHGDRDQIPAGSFGNEVLLNERGKENSIKFGKDLIGLKVNKIYTSPIGRCVQTAENIAFGYGTNIEIIETKVLGAPGLYIYDDKLAGDFFLANGFGEAYNRFINDLKIPGMLSKNLLKSKMTDYLRETTNEKGLTIYVTHDMFIAFYHYSMNKAVYTKENWIKFLSGLLLNDGKIEKRT